ncbi:cell division protein ZapA, partial [Clostridium saudiense]
MNTVTVIINGVEYNLRGKEDEKYLLDVAAYVDTKIREISGSNKKLST